MRFKPSEPLEQQLQLRAALVSQATEIEPAPDMWERVKAEITATRPERGITMWGKHLGGYLFPWQPAWKKAVAAAMCGVLLAGGLTFGLSPQARAWATEKVREVVSYKVIRTDGGYTVVKEEVASKPLKVTKPVAAKPMNNDMTPTEAEAAAGFPVSLPAYLPDGYEQVGISAGKWDNGKGSVQVLYRNAGQQHPGLSLISLMLTNDEGFLQGGDAVKEVEVGNETAYWSELPGLILPGEGEPTVKVGHMLKWEDNGVVYILRDGSGDLSRNEMLRIAESIK